MSPVLSQFNVPVTSVHKVEADGVEVFYRAAGDSSAPVVLLLHGFPASSFMFRELIPRLADQFRVIAPDLPGFGFTEVPEKRKYVYSFAALASTIEAFTDAQAAGGDGGEPALSCLMGSTLAPVLARCTPFTITQSSGCKPSRITRKPSMIGPGVTLWDCTRF